MANLGYVFDSNDVPERADFTPVQAGTYTAMITDSEMKQTSKGGDMLVLEVTIQGGEFDGRKVFERLNIKNDNQQAVDIAFQTLGQICKAVGKPVIKDSTELHNKKMSIDVVVDPAKPYMKDGVQQPGSPQNRVRKYAQVGGDTANTNKVTSSESSGSAAASSDSLPPWKRGK